MKKLFLSLVVAILTTTVCFAQNSLVATLSHGEDISMYYGTNALRDALNAAVSGDVINLSGGQFQAVDITKAVTLRGTGIDDAAPTYISGNYIINIPTDDPNRLCIEGIRCTNTVNMDGIFNSPYFVKCQFSDLEIRGNSTIKNALIVNCKITTSFYLYGSSTVQSINSYVFSFGNFSETASAAFVNCVIVSSTRGYSPQDVKNSQLLNCIVYQTYNTQTNLGGQLPSSTVATNCLTSGYINLFGAQTANVNNKSVGYKEFDKVFKNFTGTYSDDQTFELSDEAKTTYLGNDGTEVGIYGGVLPYSSKPSYPQITKMNVANKTTADGKLSVEIEVSAAE